jgi:hypothetical protein
MPFDDTPTVSYSCEPKPQPQSLHAQHKSEHLRDQSSVMKKTRAPIPGLLAHARKAAAHKKYQLLLEVLFAG